MNGNHEIEGKCPSGSFAYTIKSGDTLFQLARKYNTTVAAIIAINPGIDPNNLKIGQVICIPKAAPTPSCPNGTLYTIKCGDTLFELSKKFNVSVEAIIKANPGIEPENLQIGQVICIPGKSPTPPVPSCPNGFLYTIRSGDTLFFLSQRFNVSVQAIIKANPGIEPENLQIGQVICIPQVTPPVPSCPNGFLYTIRSGDTLFFLSQRFNVSVEAIMNANPGIDPNNLQIGQVICIPQVTPPVPSCPNGFLYTIRSGDTLFALSQRFNVSVQAIINANPGINPENLQIGQVICIPQVSSVPPTPPAPPVPPTPSCPNGFLYTIRCGDTLFALSQRFNVPVQAIINANPGIDPNNLIVGQVICIPQMAPPMPPCPNGFYYTIMAGDTLFFLSQKFNVPVQDIINANPGIDPNNLQIGQVICIPRRCVVYCY